MAPFGTGQMLKCFLDSLSSFANLSGTFVRLVHWTGDVVRVPNRGAYVRELTPTGFPRTKDDDEHEDESSISEFRSN